MQLDHCHKFIRHQFGRHNAARIQRITQRNTHQPRQGIKHIAEDLLEAHAKYAGEQGVDRANKGNKANQHRQNNHRDFKTGQNILAQHFKETLRFVQLFQFDFRFGFRACRVDDRQNNKGAEHIEDQRRDHIFRIQHAHIRADNGQRNGRHRCGRHSEQASRGEIAQHAFVSNKVFRLAQNQRTDGVKGFQLPHTIHFGQQRADDANKNRQNSPVLENTNQGRDENNRAEYAKENECQPFFAHPAKDKIGAFSGKFQQ
ncbi:hypothetical protein D3C86_1412770 [compost metagenome]